MAGPAMTKEALRVHLRPAEARELLSHREARGKLEEEAMQRGGEQLFGGQTRSTRIPLVCRATLSERLHSLSLFRRF